MLSPSISCRAIVSSADIASNSTEADHHRHTSWPFCWLIIVAMIALIMQQSVSIHDENQATKFISPKPNRSAR